MRVHNFKSDWTIENFPRSKSKWIFDSFCYYRSFLWPYRVRKLQSSYITFDNRLTNERKETEKKESKKNKKQANHHHSRQTNPTEINLIVQAKRTKINHGNSNKLCMCARAIVQLVFLFLILLLHVKCIHVISKDRTLHESQRLTYKPHHFFAIKYRKPHTTIRIHVEKLKNQNQTEKRESGKSSAHMCVCSLN